MHALWKVLMHPKEHHWQCTLPTNAGTCELHLHFDNCKDNKNLLACGFREVLVKFKIFTKVTVNFLNACILWNLHAEVVVENKIYWQVRRQESNRLQ